MVRHQLKATTLWCSGLGDGAELEPRRRSLDVRGTSQACDRQHATPRRGTNGVGHGERHGRLDVLVEVHRVVQDPSDFYRVGAGKSVDENMARPPSALPNGIDEDAGTNVVAWLAAPRVARDGLERSLDQHEVVARRRVTPTRSRVLDDLDDVAYRLRRANHAGHRPCALASEPHCGQDLGHELLRRRLDPETGVELGETDVDRFAQDREPLFFERLAHDVGNARALTGADALLGEGLEIVGEMDGGRNVRHGSGAQRKSYARVIGSSKRRAAG
jgi:hypothetical protein